MVLFSPTAHRETWSDLVDICFAESDIGWAVGENGKILHIDNGTMVNKEEFETQFSEIDFVLYPNPVKNTININYNLPENQKIKIAIYGVHGKELSILKNAIQISGNHTLQFDASSLAEGIYFIKLNTMKSTNSAKFVKLN